MSARRPIAGSATTGGDNGSGSLRRALEPPGWLHDLGISAWLIVGVALVLVGLFWALAATTEIAGPLAVGGIVATVASPLVARLGRRGLGRGVSALIVLLGLLVLAVVIFLLVVKGIAGQSGQIAEGAAKGADRMQSAMQDIGIDAETASDIKNGLERAAPAAAKGLANGLVAGVQGLASLMLGASFTIFSVFFLLKDGPKLRRVLERHVGVPEPIGRVVVGRLVTSIRGYYLGLTIVAAYNGVVVGVGAWILGVPLAATLGVVTYATAYVPFIGAFVSGAFAVLIAWGSGGTGTAVGMLIVVLLANGLLQNIVSPIAMGAALDMNPLLNLAVTVAAGCLFGMFGLILAAPLTSASLHLADDLRQLSVEPEPETGSSTLGAPALDV